jgi:hypothetical protein
LFSNVEVFWLLFVGEGVVVAAEETEVVEDCFASVCPEDNVVNVAPAGRSATAFVGAVAVSGDDGST